MAEGGYACLLLTAALAALGCLIPWIQKAGWIKQGPWLIVLMWGQTFLTFSAFFILVVGTLSHQWSWVTVFRHSHTDLPWLYMLASTWSSPEGSFLVWLMILYGTLWMWTRTSTLSDDVRDRVLHCGQWVLFGSVLCALIAGHPFQRIDHDALEGMDLNPLLNHPYLVIHPPFLYMGYGAMLPLFGLGCRQLKTSDAWIHDVRLWSLISWACLTTGISLGSAWAYTQLGWGGWWFWDPVENAALIPWLLVTGLIHMTEAHIPVVWIQRFAILPFMMAQIGVWGVRSGLWTSVHSFAQEGSWCASLGVVTMGTIGIGVWHLYHLRQHTPSQKNIASLMQPGFMLIISCVIGLAIWYPVMHEYLFRETVTISLSFYHRVVVPLCIVVVWGAALGPLVAMPRPWFMLGITLMTSGFSMGILLRMLGWRYALEHTRGVLAWGAGTALLIVACQRWIMAPKRHAVWSSAWIHVGLALSVLGMAADGWKHNQVLVLSIGQHISHDQSYLTFEDLTYTQTSRCIEYSASLKQTSPDGDHHRKYALLRYHPQRDIWTAEAAVFRDWRGDTMIVPETLIDSRTVRFSMHFHPLINLIWCGALVMIIGAWIHIRTLRQHRL